METKICSKCGRELPISEFNKCKSKKDGLNAWCKECQKQYKKQYDAEHRDEQRQYFKQYRADNAEVIKQRNKQYKADNAEAIKEYRKQHYSTIEGYTYNVRYQNLKNDRKHGRIAINEDPLPTIEQYIELLQQPDFYDGKQYHWSQMGLDRIDNNKPHTIDNVVPATTEHNIQRGRKTFEEFCELIQKKVS